MSDFKLSKSKIKRLIHSLNLAIAWNDNCIDAYKIEWKEVKGNLIKVIPKSFKRDTDIMKSDNKKFEKIRQELREILNGKNRNTQRI